MAENRYSLTGMNVTCFKSQKFYSAARTPPIFHDALFCIQFIAAEDCACTSLHTLLLGEADTLTCMCSCA